MANLREQTIFLSAAFPSGDRARKFPAADAAAIADAVTAVTRAILDACGRLVFGAHPTISPLVLLIAAEHGRQEVVEIFQSRWFDGQVPDETLRLEAEGWGTIHWTPRADTLEASLDLMRREMLKAPVAAAVFVGGMEGVVKEYQMLRRSDPRIPLLPFLAPGGAASELLPAEDLPPPLRSSRYPVAARAIVDLLTKPR